jgi:hypothetical protein
MAADPLPSQGIEAGIHLRRELGILVVIQQQFLGLAVLLGRIEGPGRQQVDIDRKAVAIPPDFGH